MTDALGREVNLEILRVLRRLANGAMEPILMTNISFKPAPDSQLNPLLLPIQLPYLMVDRIINRVESVLQLNESDRETLRAMRRLMEIFRRATINPSVAKNPLTAGAAERREWQNGDVSNQEKDDQDGDPRSFPMAVIRNIPALRPRDVAATAKKIAPLVPEVMPGAQVMAGKFIRRLAGRALVRIAENVMPEGTAAAEARDLLADQIAFMGTEEVPLATIVGGSNGKPPRKVVG
ncbi:unnamed protein product [Ascophyllum nodosum]